MLVENRRGYGRGKGRELIYSEMSSNVNSWPRAWDAASASSLPAAILRPECC